MGVVIAFRSRSESVETVETDFEDEDIDLLTAVDVAIRDLREISRHWGEESARVQAAACLEMLERAFTAAI